MSRSRIQKEYISISNVNVYCEYILNGKPPIVLIHGYLSSTYTFNRLMPLLTEHFSVIAIDLPGFGRSEKSRTFYYSFANYGKLVLECMDYFGIEKAFLAGHSMGGQLVINAAKIAPERVQKLILLCSSGYQKRVNKSLVFSSYLPFFHIYARRYIGQKTIREALEDVLYDHSLITDEMMTEFERPLLQKDFYKSLIRLLRHREGDLPSSELAKIDTQALLIWGEEDKVVPLNIGKRLVRDLPNATLISYPQTGHLITEERPRELFQDIVSFTDIGK
ncbi:alpha/beta fold hydrolase [Salirhabdus salicampi]|uniref:alpha/beta fold hydrolase n=1 Tax=Salirhabdus salicampi TaxID=476102 RepID=UPI0020C44772|nr:alpha/beta hydrolase [Salirhabdus salicampi]MCP8615272.1 alpha/beta hydrolase [Salirhabdus salicampi]